LLDHIQVWHRTLSSALALGELVRSVRKVQGLPQLDAFLAWKWDLEEIIVAAPILPADRIHSASPPSV
jgi:hypothetical protein